MYNEIKGIQKLLWKHDDMMDQETLFDLQEIVGALALKIAQKEHKEEQLLKDFPHIYKMAEVKK
jgi:hypothetical protein